MYLISWSSPYYVLVCWHVSIVFGYLLELLDIHNGYSEVHDTGSYFRAVDSYSDIRIWHSVLQMPLRVSFLCRNSLQVYFMQLLPWRCDCACPRAGGASLMKPGIHSRCTLSSSRCPGAATVLVLKQVVLL